MRVYGFAGADFRLETRTIAAVKAGAARAKNMLADQPPMVVRAELLNRSIFSFCVYGLVLIVLAFCGVRGCALLFSFWPWFCGQQKLCCSVLLGVPLARCHACPTHSRAQRIYAGHFLSNLQSLRAQPAF